MIQQVEIDNNTYALKIENRICKVGNIV